MIETSIQSSPKSRAMVCIFNDIASRWHATRKALCLALCVTVISAGPAYADITAKVINIIDGDTIKIRLDGNVLKVRLQGIDAPERGQPFNKESTRHLKSLIAGEMVTIRASKTDRYGRIIGQIFATPKNCKTCPHSWDINLEQIKAGYAWWYKYYPKEQSWSDQRAYRTAQSKARSERLGLWAEPNPINPYDWRKQKRYE